MNNMSWLEPEEWESCRKYMDYETFEEFQMFVKAEEPFSVGVPLPIIEIVDVCESRQKWKEWNQINKINLREKSNSYKNHDYYKELYRFLAYTLYGYGNWSNNDRRQKGMKFIRFR